MLASALFYLISFVAVLSAIGVVVSRSPVYSVLCLVAVMCMLAGLFILLKAFLVATILVLVYAGAILVLFLFVVMWVDFRKLSADWQAWNKGWAVFLSALLCLQIFRVIRTVPLEPLGTVHGTAEAVGRVLFHRYLLPFELTAFLLLAAIVSVVVLAKKDAQ
jgi:NADH-quinone oxidoreductase subunit J